MLELREREQLLQVARRSIAGGLDSSRPAALPPENWPGALLQTRASFTTLKLAGELRGCCGVLEARQALVCEVWHTAWVSAFADPRFPPLSAAELGALDVTISVLSPLQPIAAESERELLEALQPGIDGLVLAAGAARETFLPAMWQMLPDPVDFVAQLKRKAGWRLMPPGVRFYRYTTETFGSAGRVDGASDRSPPLQVHR